MTDQLKTLGEKVSSFAGFETFPKSDGIKSVTCVSDEVTAVCPVTGQPDWYTVRIEYQPDQKCLESKTLKLYLQSFRNAGHFCEDFARIIARDIFDSLSPHQISVTVYQKPRGGVEIQATAEFRK